MTRTIPSLVALSALLLLVAASDAATTCSFTSGVSTMRLVEDCTTDATIFVADGLALEGAGHTITAVDPFGGHFQGAIVRNAGAFAVVKNLRLNTLRLADVCDTDGERLRGILFDGASGIIANNVLTDINQGESGCQEGSGIEVRNALFEPGGSDVLVWIGNNVVTNYQKTGILLNGSVAATIIGNEVTGAGPVTYIAQNGIQIGFGATAIVQENEVSGNDYTPHSFISCGLLMFDADGVRASQNAYRNNEQNVCVFGRGEGQFNPEP